MSIKRINVLCAAIFSAFLISSCTTKPTSNIAVDVLITSTNVLVGDGSEARALDIGICQEKICAVLPKGQHQFLAKKVIDAGDKLVSPGFIDPHTHSLAELENPETAANLNYLTQGVTTVVNGNDGGDIVDIASIKDKLNQQGIGTNTALLVGHGSVREHVMGRSERQATADELAAMKALVNKAMLDGAIGLSTGLYYVPGSYASTEEVIELARIASNYDGIYDTHLRDESTFNIGFTQAVDEAIDIVKAANIHLHLAHIKALGVDVWGQSSAVIDKVNRARENGVSISADQYPWQASGTHLHSAVVPKWVMADSQQAFVNRLNDLSLRPKIMAQITENIRRRGGADALLFTVANDESIVGKTLKDVAQERGLNASELVIELVQGAPIRVASFNMSADDIRQFMQQPWVVTSSDGTNGHPRKYASFPKKYRQYVLEESVLTLPQFVMQSSYKTAQAIKLPERGLLTNGFFADIIIVDLKKYKDKASFSHWNVLSEGVETVIVNGSIVIENSQFTNILAGRVLTKK